MKLIVNDEEVEVAAPATVTALLAQLGYPEKGVAVAVDYTVRPKSAWEQPLSEGDRIEVLTAVQGG
ncbi:MAG: sulfur carrier protein ThiS [Mycolicibacterium insubricum]|jgi:sulfur carrier protein